MISSMMVAVLSKVTATSVTYGARFQTCRGHGASFAHLRSRFLIAGSGEYADQRRPARQLPESFSVA